MTVKLKKWTCKEWKAFDNAEINRWRKEGDVMTKGSSGKKLKQLSW